MRRGVRRLAAVGAMAGVGILGTALSTGVASAMPSPPPPIPMIPCGDTAALKARIVALNQFTGATPPIVLAKHCVYILTDPSTTTSENGADGLPQIKADIRIDGRGSSIVRASQPRFRLVHIRPGGELTLNDLTLANGAAGAGAGGAILDQGTLTLNDTIVQGDTAGEGGGLSIAHGAKARVTGSTFVANHSAGRGGAIANSGGTLTITDTAVTGNSANTGGGGVAVFGKGTVTVSGGHIQGNTSQTGAGGVYVDGGTLNLEPTADITGNAPTNCAQSPTSVQGCEH